MIEKKQRVLGTVIGHTSPNHNSNSKYRNPTFYHIGDRTKRPGMSQGLGFRVWGLGFGVWGLGFGA